MNLFTYMLSTFTYLMWNLSILQVCTVPTSKKKFTQIQLNCR